MNNHTCFTHLTRRALFRFKVTMGEHLQHTSLELPAFGPGMPLSYLFPPPFARVEQIQIRRVSVEQAFRPALRARYLPRGFSPWARAEATESIGVRLDAALKRRSTSGPEIQQ